jgi:hypothetical protein
LIGEALDARLAGTAVTLHTRLFELSEGWAPERRADLLVRYLGFPYWDVLLFPLQSVADASDRDTIDVVRMSPATPSCCRRSIRKRSRGSWPASR